MSKTFRPWKIDEPLLLPVRVADFVGERHLARFVLSVVQEDIDLTAIAGTYGSERGQPPFHPIMMTALLLYAYCSGINSSRRIAKACCERVDFMSIVGLDAPDFRTISDFRQRHAKALKDAVQSGVAAVRDGRPGEARACGVRWQQDQSQCVQTRRRVWAVGERAAELEAEVAGWLSAAEAADAAEDKLPGGDKSGEEMPDWVADKQRRAAKIRQAKAELEAEAQAAAEAKLKEQADAAAKREAEGQRKGGRPAAPPSATPDAKAQKNFTDPQSRIMKSMDGFVQAYNVQIGVDAEAQIIVAADVTQSAVDCAQLLPMADAVEANLGRRPAQVSADAGYCSDDNLAGLEQRNIDAYVATGRARDAVAGTAKANSRPSRAGSIFIGPTDPPAGYAREDQSRRTSKPLPAAQATPRAGVRADQAGARLPAVLAAWHRKGPRRVGSRLHRPQPVQARPQPEFVHSDASGHRGSVKR